jgi:hypothetical protein
MWPSMMQSQPKRPKMDLSLADWTSDSSTHSDISTGTPTDTLGSEKNSLERWLQEDLELRPQQDSPVESIVHSDGDFSISSAPQHYGFDDDFTAFVSAPPADGVSHSSFDEISMDEDKLLPRPAGSLYASLGSVEDLGSDGMTSQISYVDDDETRTNAEARVGANRVPESHPFAKANLSARTSLSPPSTLTYLT